MATDRVDVSVLIPVLNEEQHLPEAARRMREQRFDGKIEFIFVDGQSIDGTRRLLEQLAADDERFRVLDNPHRRTPQALNIALRAARGEFVARMDAHTLYPPDYLARGVERLRRGDVDWVSGPQLAVGAGPGSRRAALALTTLIGTGGARFRREMEDELEVDTGFTGVWRKSTLDAEGGWDEEWVNDQDFELAARIRKRGGRIVCLPEMAASYIPRDSLRELARQYWRYGFYRVKTIRRHPHSMRRSHALPPALATTAVAAVVAPRALRRLARAGAGAYAAALLVATARATRDHPLDEVAALPAVLAVMHLSYGFGFLAGCARFGPPLDALAHAAGVARG